jgi:hypothetical protein
VPTLQGFGNLVRNEATAIQEERNSTIGADERYADVYRAQAPSGIVEVVSDDFPVLHAYNFAAFALNTAMTKCYTLLAMSPIFANPLLLFRFST